MLKLSKTTRRQCGRVLGVLALLAGFCIPTWAEVYRGRPVTLGVPFPPGGVADTVGRPVAESMALVQLFWGFSEKKLILLQRVRRRLLLR